ncbi:acyltransferase family protein [Azospirillum agricola]|uniref:acyltransferase family protein n=1 Tax=Azospirillum agricola TaxID=1720247 RepID=UPI0015C49E9A|nr:acyltransferase family protein [Azospirillum agricola]
MPAINGLRAFAILGVIYHHYTWDHLGPLNPDSPIAGLWLPLRVVLEGGWLGVNLFFFLSGLVLYLPYAQGNRSMDGPKAGWTFLAHRLRRLLPLYYLVGALSLAFGLVQPFSLTEPGTWKQFLTFLTVTFNFFPDTFMPAYNWVLWSLGIEVWFSLLFPLLLPVYRRWPAATLAGAIAVAVGLRYAGTVPFNGNVLNWIADSLPARLPDFLAGMLAADLAVRKRAWTANPATFLAGGALCLLGAWGWHAWFLGALPVKTAAGLTIVLDVGFLLVAVFLLTRRTWLSRLLAFWPLQLIGMMCYSLYVWHGLLEYRLVLTQTHDFAARLESLPMYLFFLLFVSVLSFRYIEFGNHPARELFLPPRVTHLPP